MISERSLRNAGGEPLGLTEPAGPSIPRPHFVRAWAGNDLAQALAALGAELAARESIRFSLVVEGRPRALSPIAEHEICRIACGVLRNAFRHAHTRRIEAEILYGARLLRLRIRNDGKGMNANNPETGCVEMRGIGECVKRLGARLDFWSGAKTGTEVELTVPDSTAFAQPYRRYRFAQDLNVRLEERTSERTRIVRELHEMLLQSFEGFMLRFQSPLTYFRSVRQKV